MRLQDRIALITGGTQGIGRAAAERLGSEGAIVVVVASRDRHRAAAVARRIKDTGGRADAEVGDVTDRESVTAELVSV